MNVCSIFRGSTPVAVLAAVFFLITRPSNADGSGNMAGINTNTLSSALANALGGMTSVKKIHTLHFEFKALSFHAAPSNSVQTFQGAMHLAGEEWLTSDGDVRSGITGNQRTVVAAIGVRICLRPRSEQSEQRERQTDDQGVAPPVVMPRVHTNLPICISRGETNRSEISKNDGDPTPPTTHTLDCGKVACW